MVEFRTYVGARLPELTAVGPGHHRHIGLAFRDLQGEARCAIVAQGHARQAVAIDHDGTHLVTVLATCEHSLSGDVARQLHPDVPFAQDIGGGYRKRHARKGEHGQVSGGREQLQRQSPYYCIEE